jgi:hypothetical protein
MPWPLSQAEVSTAPAGAAFSLWFNFRRSEPVSLVMFATN